MLNHNKLSVHKLHSSQHDTSISVVEHPGWWETIRNSKTMVQDRYFPLNGLNGRTLQQEVQFQIQKFINRKINHGYVIQ